MSKLNCTLLFLLTCLLSTSIASGQDQDQQRLTVTAGYSVPQAGYYWSGSTRWTNEAHYHIRYERAITRGLYVGALTSYDQQRSGNLGVRALSGGLRGSYLGLQAKGFSLAPYVEMGAVALVYVSHVEHLVGSTRVASRAAMGASVGQRIWGRASVVAEVDYQIVVDRFDGFDYVGMPPAPRGPETSPPPSFHFTATRLGLSWSF